MSIKEIAGWLCAVFLLGFLVGHAAGGAGANYDAARARGFHYRGLPYACQRIRPSVAAPAPIEVQAAR